MQEEALFQIAQRRVIYVDSFSCDFGGGPTQWRTTSLGICLSAGLAPMGDPRRQVARIELVILSGCLRLSASRQDLISTRTHSVAGEDVHGGDN